MVHGDPQHTSQKRVSAASCCTTDPHYSSLRFPVFLLCEALFTNWSVLTLRLALRPTHSEDWIRSQSAVKLVWISRVIFTLLCLLDRFRKIPSNSNVYRNTSDELTVWTELWTIRTNPSGDGGLRTPSTWELSPSCNHIISTHSLKHLSLLKMQNILFPTFIRLSECQRSGQCVFSKQLLLKS